MNYTQVIQSCTLLKYLNILCMFVLAFGRREKTRSCADYEGLAADRQVHVDPPGADWRQVEDNCREGSILRHANGRHSVSIHRARTTHRR